MVACLCYFDKRKKKLRKGDKNMHIVEIKSQFLEIPSSYTQKGGRLAKYCLSFLFFLLDWLFHFALFSHSMDSYGINNA
jgi:hypothetical protein